MFVYHNIYEETNSCARTHIYMCNALLQECNGIV